VHRRASRQHRFFANARDRFAPTRRPARPELRATARRGEPLGRGDALRKHSVTFEEAATVFYDQHALVLQDLTHADRLLILGTSARARLLFVVYVEVEADDVFRIIGARKATPHERKAYEGE
jgi:uncharacterized DUF497 family protein